MSDETTEKEVFNSVEAYYAIARALRIRGEYKRALYYIDVALQHDSQHIPSYLLRSFCNMRLFELDKALEDVQFVLNLEPKNPHALLLLGEIYYLRGDLEEALRTFHRGHALRPTIENFQRGVHKCEIAIGETCKREFRPNSRRRLTLTFGSLEYKIRLSPELDLTEFYLRAFPPRNTNVPANMLERPPEQVTTKQAIPWPKARPRDIQKKLYKAGLVDLDFLEVIYRQEDKRSRNLKRATDIQGALHDIIERSEFNRDSAASCATYMDRHAELWHKLDPGLRNTKGAI